MRPLVSFVVHLQNRLDSLPRLLDSVLAQSLKECEVILVDEAQAAPGKNSAPLVAAYRNKGLNVTFLAGGGIRAGMAAAKADIVAFAEPDGIVWGSTALEHNIRLFAREKPDILHFRTALIDAAGKFQVYAPHLDALAQPLEGTDIFTAYTGFSDFWRSCFLWNKLLSRELCETILAADSQTVLSGHGEQCWLTTLAMFHARRSLGSRKVGYAHRDAKPQGREAMASAIAMYRAVRAIPAYLAGHDCPQELIERCECELRKIFSWYAGQLTLAMEPENGTIPDEQLAALLEMVDEDTLLDLLLLGNYLNVRKILGCLRAIFHPATGVKS